MTAAASLTRPKTAVTRRAVLVSGMLSMRKRSGACEGFFEEAKAAGGIGCFGFGAAGGGNGVDFRDQVGVMLGKVAQAGQGFG